MRDLTAREREILETVARTGTYKQAAQQLGIKVTTVQAAMCRIYDKLECARNARSAILKADRLGLITLGDDD